MNRLIIRAIATVKSNPYSRGLTAEDMFIQLSLNMYAKRQSALQRLWADDRRDAQIMRQKEEFKRLYGIGTLPAVFRSNRH